MEDTIIKAFLELGTTGAFLVYLFIRNGKQDRTYQRVADMLDNMNNTIDRNTKVLIKVAQKHKLMEEAEELIEE